MSKNLFPGLLSFLEFRSSPVFFVVKLRFLCWIFMIAAVVNLVRHLLHMGSFLLALVEYKQTQKYDAIMG